MTTKERTAVQALFNKWTELDNIRTETLHKLQQMNVEHGDGSRWCSWKGNLDGIIANTEPDSVERGRAFTQYERFIAATAQQDMLSKFGQEMANLGFWKGKK